MGLCVLKFDSPLPEDHRANILSTADSPRHQDPSFSIPPLPPTRLAGVLPTGGMVDVVCVAPRPSYRPELCLFFVLVCLVFVWLITCQSPRGPELTADVQALLQLQLNCCHTGSSTAAACCHRGCPQRLRYTKWAGGSRSLTHKRADMGGFTLDDGYVRDVAADAQRFTGSLLDLILDVPDAFFQNTILLTTKSLVPIPVPVSRANAYSGGVLARALSEGLRNLST